MTHRLADSADSKVSSPPLAAHDSEPPGAVDQKARRPIFWSEGKLFAPGAKRIRLSLHAAGLSASHADEKVVAMFKKWKDNSTRIPQQICRAIPEAGARVAPGVKRAAQYSMKQIGLVVMVSISLYSLVALANHASFSEMSSRDASDDRQADYLQRVGASLDRLESYLDQLRASGVAYASIESYMTVDDIELLIKDVRGDLSKLQALREAPPQSAENAINSKLADIRDTLSRVVKPANPNEATKPIVVVTRE